MENKKRVILLIPNLGLGGQEKMATLMGNVLRSDYDVEIVSFYSEEKEFKNEISMVSLLAPPKNGLWGKTAQLLKRIIRFGKIRKQYRPYAVVSFGPSANIVNVFTKKVGRTIISFRGYASLKKNVLNTICCKRADGIYCISQGMCDELANIYPKIREKISLVYNGCDIESIKALSKCEAGKTLEHPVVISMGRLEKIKGFLHLLNAFRLVVTEQPNVKLAVIGEGSQQNFLRKKSEELGISDKVSFLGGFQNPFPIFSQGDICVQTSINEGFMNVLVEAGVCGLPVISTDCKAGPREILAPGSIDKTADQIEYAEYGILVPPFATTDTDEPEKEAMLAEAILKLLSDKELYLAYQNKSAACANRFSSNEYKKATVLLIEKI